MAELNFNIIPVVGSIKFENFEENLEILKLEASKYKNLVFTDDSIQEAKQTRANLNKVVEKIDARRKEIKKIFLQPYEELEKQLKQMVEVVKDANSNIDKQVKEFEERMKLEKKGKILELWDSYGYNKIHIDKIFQERWLNKTCTLKMIAAEMQEIIKDIDKNITMIVNLFKDNQNKTKKVVADYLITLDVSQALAKNDADEKAESLSKEIVNELTNGIKAEDEAMYKLKFEVVATREQINKLSEFLRENKIDYRRVE